MTSQLPTKTSLVFAYLWPWFFFTAAFESLIFAAILFSIPSEGGISLARFGLLSILLLAFVLGLNFGLRARHSTAAWDNLPYTRLIIGAALLSLTCGLALFLLRYLNPQLLLSAYERLSPLLWFFFIFGIQSALFLLLLRNGFHPDALAKRKPVYISSAFVLAGLLAVLIFVSATKLGTTPDTAYWGEPGVAILGWHFGLSLLVGFIFLIYQLHITKIEASRLVNLAVPMGIWLTASILWLSVPWDVLSSSFYAPITPPANIPLPYSDAGFYDYLSQSLLIGADYTGVIPPRPLYVVFLAGLHALFGQDYVAVITAQTLVLALFPVALYFLGKKLHSPAAGVTVALFAIFREYLGLWISSNTRVANSRIFTTDFPTALGIAILCLVVIWWLERRDIKSSLIAGGAFGLLLLLRTQSLLVLPVILLLAWFAFGRQPKKWLVACAALFISLAATLTPWMMHNYTVTGQFTFDDPAQQAVIYSQYSFTGNLDISQFDFQNESVGNRLIDFALANPGYVAGFITNHFLNTQIGGLLALPLIERYDGLFAPVNLYWVSWSGAITWYNLLLVLLYLAIVAVGISSAWRKLGWIGLAPLAFNLGYALSNGIARFSSWRYNMPVDWVIYFYFGLGVIEVLAGLALLFGAKLEQAFPRSVKSSLGSERASGPVRKSLVSFASIVLAFAFVGSLPWLAKGLVSPRYTSSQEELRAHVSTRLFPEGEVDTLLSQPDAVILEGRLMYPRMYRREQGISSANPWPAYQIRDYARLSFILLNSGRYDVIFPTRDLLDFPQGADTIVLGCQRDGYIEARFVQFDNASYQSAPLTEPCN